MVKTLQHLTWLHKVAALAVTTETVQVLLVDQVVVAVLPMEI
jgi:hypothetical protein